MPSMSALTTFTDGVVVHQADLNNLSTNIDSLCQITLGKAASSATSTKPLCKVSLNTDLLIAHNTDTIFSWNQADYNTDNMWVSGAANQITIQTAGKYRITVQGDWAQNSNGIRCGKIFINGTSNSNAVGGFQLQAAPGYDTVANASALVPLAVGAVIYYDVFQTSGVPLYLTTTFGSTWMVAEWVAPF